VTVILLIVGHRPVFQPGPGRELLCPPQTAPRNLSDSPNTPTACISVTPRGWSTLQLHFGKPGGTIPGHGTLPGQKRDQRELNMRGLELTGRPGAAR
jgi:hypothetical protein